MQNWRVWLAVPLIIGVGMLSSCRTRGPNIDRGYYPGNVKKGGSDQPVRSRSNTGSGNSMPLDNDWFDQQKESAAVHTTESWSPFSAQPMATADLPFAEIDRRWDSIYFAYNQIFIGETERQKLEMLADYLMDNQEFHLLVEGHCDERGSEEFNRSLGEKRAIAVRDYLAGIGVDGMRIRTISYGEDRPADSGLTETAYRLNRRAELVIGVPPR